MARTVEEEPPLPHGTFGSGLCPISPSLRLTRTPFFPIIIFLFRGLHASTLPPPSSVRVASSSSSPAGSNAASGKPGSVTVEDLAKQLEPFGVTGIRFGDDGQEDELAVCCPESRRLMDCTVDMYASINGTNYCVALPIFSPVAICYHKNDRLIPVENECELMDRLYDFLAPTLEQEDLFLIRSPVCLTLDGDLGDLGEDGEFSEEELAGWEAFESEEDPWQDGEEEEEDDDEEEKANKAEPLDEEIERLVRCSSGGKFFLGGGGGYVRRVCASLCFLLSHLIHLSFPLCLALFHRQTPSTGTTPRPATCKRRTGRTGRRSRHLPTTGWIIPWSRSWSPCWCWPRWTRYGFF